MSASLPSIQGMTPKFGPTCLSPESALFLPVREDEMFSRESGTCRTEPSVLSHHGARRTPTAFTDTWPETLFPWITCQPLAGRCASPASPSLSHASLRALLRWWVFADGRRRSRLPAHRVTPSSLPTVSIPLHSGPLTFQNCLHSCGCFSCSPAFLLRRTACVSKPPL